MQSGAYQNGTWVVGVAKGGVEEGVDSLAQSMIIAPSGQIVAQALSSDDELVAARCDLDWCARYKGTVFDFDRYRRPEMYGRITEQRGVIRPDLAVLSFTTVRCEAVPTDRSSDLCGELCRCVEWYEGSRVDLGERRITEGGGEAMAEIHREVRIGVAPHEPHASVELVQARARPR